MDNGTDNLYNTGSSVIARQRRWDGLFCLINYGSISASHGGGKLRIMTTPRVRTVRVYAYRQCDITYNLCGYAALTKHELRAASESPKPQTSPMAACHTPAA